MAMIQSQNTNCQAGVAKSKPRGYEVIDLSDNPPLLLDFIQSPGRHGLVTIHNIKTTQIKIPNKFMATNDVNIKKDFFSLKSMI